MLRPLLFSALLLASACLHQAGVAEPREFTVAVPAGEITLRAEMGLPFAKVTGPAVVALHGCGGPYPDRDGQWRDILTKAGHPVLFPDSFGSRGMGPQCRVQNRTVSPGRERREDTVASVQWLRAQGFTPQGGVAVVGWSNGGSTVLATAADARLRGQVRGFVAFYPGCRAYAERPGWAPLAPLLILIGTEDDWTPAEPCRRLAARFPGRIRLVEYPGAHHDFDAPDRPLRLRTGLAQTGSGTGIAHAGTDPAARAQAIEVVLRYLAALPPKP